jgi:hypothetical protein
VNFHHLTGEPVGPKTSRELQTKHPSMSKAAIYQRQYRLTMDDAKKAMLDKSKKASVNKAKIAKCVMQASWKGRLSNNEKYLQKLIRHHLSKGRSVADIAIRENMMVSKVQAVVDRIDGGAA